MDLEQSPNEPETDRVTVVVTVVEGTVDEIRAFGDRERAKDVCERIEEDEPWKTVELESFHVPGHLEDMREEYLAWMRSQ